jgi:serine/threonine-protein kinase
LSRHLATLAIAVAGTVVTYLLMHYVVGPHLPLSESEVPEVKGMPPEQARALLSPRGLLLVLDGELSDDKQAAGTLAEQRPLKGSHVYRGSEVHALIVVAPKSTHVPAVVGMSLADASAALSKAHLRAGVVVNAASDSVPKGNVISSVPASGAEAPLDSAVDLDVSSGLDAVQVPKVTGKRLSAAKDLLEKAGLVVGAITKRNDDEAEEGVVLKQSVAAGESAARGAKIDLVVNAESSD